MDEEGSAIWPTQYGQGHACHHLVGPGVISGKSKWKIEQVILFDRNMKEQKRKHQLTFLHSGMANPRLEEPLLFTY